MPVSAFCEHNSQNIFDILFYLVLLAYLFPFGCLFAVSCMACVVYHLFLWFSFLPWRCPSSPTCDRSANRCCWTSLTRWHPTYQTNSALRWALIYSFSSRFPSHPIPYGLFHLRFRSISFPFHPAPPPSLTPLLNEIGSCLLLHGPLDFIYQIVCERHAGWS